MSKINKIEITENDEKVYNLELESNSSTDDLFWIEQDSGVISNNCLTKDLGAYINFAKKAEHYSGAADVFKKFNDEIRTDRDWERMIGRAVIFDTPQINK
mgnify:CR=1 FL=1